MAKSWKLTPARIYAIKEFFAMIGEKEAENQNVSVRKREEGDMGIFSVNDLLEMLKKEVEEA